MVEGQAKLCNVMMRDNKHLLHFNSRKTQTSHRSDERQETFNSFQSWVNPNKSEVNEMLVLILNKVETLNEVLGEMRLGLSQLSHIVFSHATSIKSLEACFSALSTQVHNSTRGNGKKCMDITTETSAPCEIGMGPKTPLFGAIEDWG